MWTENKIFNEDMELLVQNQNIPWERFHGKAVLVTGATGLLGYSVVSAVLYYSMKTKADIKVYAWIRNREKFERKYERQLKECPNLFCIEGDICKLPDIKEKIDFIIHAASETGSRNFIEFPVETIETAVMGTKNVLELAKDKRVEEVLYLSTMEVYGYPAKGHRVKESDVCMTEPMKVRNSYPLGKLLCENVCCAYAQEYKVPVKVLRLTQTFGPGIEYNDQRVFAEFARCVMEKKKIVLKTEGLTSRSYLYTRDAVSAILKVLLDGKSGQAYHAANEETYCTIREMAEMMVDLGAGKVEIQKSDISKMGYADTLYMDLDTSLLRKLGWKAEVGLKESYKRMIKSMGI